MHSGPNLFTDSLFSTLINMFAINTSAKIMGKEKKNERNIDALIRRGKKCSSPPGLLCLPCWHLRDLMVCCGALKAIYLLGPSFSESAIAADSAKRDLSFLCTCGWISKQIYKENEERVSHLRGGDADGLPVAATAFAMTQTSNYRRKTSSLCGAFNHRSFFTRCNYNSTSRDMPVWSWFLWCKLKNSHLMGQTESVSPGHGPTIALRHVQVRFVILI